MSDQPWVIETEPEVLQWLQRLSDKEYATAERAVDDHLLINPLAAANTNAAKYLGDGLWELRFDLGDNSIRIPYYLASGRRIVLLTVFRKTRQRERREVDRAKLAKKTCEAEHTSATHEYDRAEEER